MARGADIFRRASRAFSALSSWEMEMQAFTTTMTRMMAASSQSSPPLAHRDRAAAASSTRIMGSFICPRKRSSSPCRLPSSSRLGPQRASRRSASAPLSPRDLSVSSSDRVCLVLYVCHTPMSLAPRSL